MDNPQAFPIWVKNSEYSNGGYVEGGMTLRDYFAAKAMNGLLAHDLDQRWSSNAALAREAYLIADAMLAARCP